MKGNISIKDFVKKVKDEIMQSIDDENPLFELDKIDLEITFQLEGNASAGFNLVVFDAEPKATATQTHKVKLSLTPVVKRPDDGDGPKGYKVFGNVVGDGHPDSMRNVKRGVVGGRKKNMGMTVSPEKENNPSKFKRITLEDATVKVEG